MVWIPALVEVGLGLAAFAPFLVHRLSVGKWRKQVNEYPVNDADLPAITVLLPVWNEGLIIEKKLDNLAQQNLRCSLLVIDSASTDETVSKINAWIQSHPKAFDDFTLLRMKERLGKTEAVRQAIEKLEKDGFNGCICMTDADAMLPPDALSRLQGWFADPTVGAVGARALRHGTLSSERSHRTMFELLREGESARDSTPFLEGSCMMWKRSAFNSQQLNTRSNADDAQIATGVRLNGFRSLYDSNVHFEDMAPSTPEGQRRQKIRRGQGLQRLLMSHRKSWFDRRLGTFASILRREAHFHLIAPLMLFGAGMAAVLRWGIITIAGMPNGTLAALHGSLACIELTCLVAWLLNRQGIRVPLLATVGSVFSGMEHLVIGHWHSLRGKSLHMWDQHSDTRIALSESDLN
ncbi:MAG: glycosyltransferase [Euryarchaeota archaeon]|jgi:cellulose synthase/poly-beta-1,6-N-acetylglucosamine synthase-like glycosyltransferase|nr:glycosyltransferase [Euryarchaeota archaeon]